MKFTVTYLITDDPPDGLVSCVATNLTDGTTFPDGGPGDTPGDIVTINNNFVAKSDGNLFVRIGPETKPNPKWFQLPEKTPDFLQFTFNSRGNNILSVLDSDGNFYNNETPGDVVDPGGVKYNTPIYWGLSEGFNLDDLELTKSTPVTVAMLLAGCVWVRIFRRWYCI